MTLFFHSCIGVTLSLLGKALLTLLPQSEQADVLLPQENVDDLSLVEARTLLAQSDALLVRQSLEKLHSLAADASITHAEYLSLCLCSALYQRLGSPPVLLAPLALGASSSPLISQLMQGYEVFFAQAASPSPLALSFLRVIGAQSSPSFQGTLQGHGQVRDETTKNVVMEVFAFSATQQVLDHATRHRLGGQEEVLQLETHIDHLSGEEIGLLLDALSACPEVLDVLWLTGIGKKNRPLALLRVLCLPEEGEKVGQVLLRHSHSLGYREQLLTRHVQPRKACVAPLADGTLCPAKRYEIEGVCYERIESDALKEQAQKRGVGAPALRFTPRKQG